MFLTEYLNISIHQHLIYFTYKNADICLKCETIRVSFFTYQTVTYEGTITSAYATRLHRFFNMAVPNFTA
jgi:hypothetical protein